MPVSYEQLMALQRPGLQVQYTDKDSMLYALSVGMAAGGIDEATLPYVYEGRAMRTLPSMATVLMRAPVPESGVDFRRLLHGEQRVSLHREIPASGTLLVDAGVRQVIDKGPDKGSVVVFESHARTPEGEPVFSTETVMLARGDGGIGGPTGTLRPPHAIPDRAPDRCLSVQVRPDQALLYRLNEDRNPLHVDPELARRAGFPAPILHGLCSYGLVCGALVRELGEAAAARISAYDARFAGVVFAGEALEVDLWTEGDTWSFRCRAPARGQVVIDNGRLALRAA